MSLLLLGKMSCPCQILPMRTAADIHAACAAFDGVRVAPLRTVLKEPLSDAALGAVLDGLCGPNQVAASWIVKALAEMGTIREDALTQAFAALRGMQNPDAALHILQSVHHAPHLAHPFRPHLMSLVEHPRLLLRIWALDACCRTARSPAERADAAARVGQALRDRSGAMRARARALAPEFGVEFPPKS
ncbi:MAG: hypothetical protein GDA52_03095 [Rhodobacteraceae bacterium]|nr:hypothetical protein [Paracoccaceae bacterium]